jgi:D-alanyl-D-alanine carboxypeptidase
MHDPRNDNAGRLRGRREPKPRAAAVIAVVALVSFAAVACSSGEAERPAGEEPRTVTASDRAEAFPTAAFADISEDPVSDQVAAEFQAALKDMAGGAGMAATVMSPDGTWSGATGKADGVRDVRVDDQFAIGSVTKSIVAAQVMQMVEAGEIGLDDPVDDYLPADLDFDTNNATIRQLLGHRSGIPDIPDAFLTMQKAVLADPQRVWKLAHLLRLVPADRAPAGDDFEYNGTDYPLLGEMIEHVRGRPVADVLRDGVLRIDGVERLIYQPDEVPTEPMAMPDGKSTAALDKGGGYLPSLAGATAAGPDGGMASDSPSLARWWRAFCAGEIVSQASLTEMTAFEDEVGLGLFILDGGAVGHPGEHFGYAAWAGCLPAHGSVIVVLHNRNPDDVSGMAGPLVEAVQSE